MTVTDKTTKPVDKAGLVDKVRRLKLVIAGLTVFLMASLMFPLNCKSDVSLDGSVSSTTTFVSKVGAAAKASVESHFRGQTQEDALEEDAADQVSSSPSSTDSTTLPRDWELMQERKKIMALLSEDDGIINMPGMDPISLKDDSNVKFMGKKIDTGWAVDKRCIEAFRNKRPLIGYGVGCGKDISWDLGMVDNFGFNMFLFDPTPKAIKHVNSNLKHKRLYRQKIRFTHEGMGNTTRNEVFVIPRRKGLPSWHPGLKDSERGTHKTVILPMNTLRNWMDKFGHTHLDVLKIDIEGSEYEVLEQMMEWDWFPFTQLLVEYHARFLPGGLEDPRHIKVMQALYDKGYRRFYDREGSGEEYSLIHMADLVQCVRKLSEAP